MKRLIGYTVAMLLCFAVLITVGVSMAHATVVAAAPNNSNGYIVLLPVTAIQNGWTCDEGTHVAVAWGDAGRLYGCWTPSANGGVMVEWSTGDISTHRQTDFRPVDVEL